MLSERYAARLSELLLPIEGFHPCPGAGERPAWEALPAALRSDLIAAGESHLGRAWEPLPATLFLQYAREGDRSRYEQASFGRRAALAALVAAECAEGAGRFADDAINGIWAICEESFWGVPAHNDGQPLPDAGRPIVDLFAGETAALLAWTHHLLRPRLDAVSARVAGRIRGEVRRRVLDPFLERDDFWWMGLAGPPGRDRVNNWNPWCNSNVLAAALLLEEAPERRAAAAGKVLRSLDRFLDPHPADGGCDEGTSYWDRAGGALFDALELLRAASAGAIDVYGEPLIREIGRFLYRAHIDGEWFVNFADGGARVHISADLVHRYGRAIGDAGLAGLGAAAHRAGRRAGAGLPGSLPRLLPALWNFAAIEADAQAGAAPPYLRDAWLPDVQVMAARERGGSARGLYVAAKGGHNAESHNHNDVGQFILYVDGRPAVVDAGVGTYTAQTFGARRYDLWTMRSSHHNVPQIGEAGQGAGAAFRARDATREAGDGAAELSLDIAAAYPAEAGVQAWRRTVRLVRGGAAGTGGAEGAGPAGEAARVEVVDEFRLRSPVGGVRLHLLVCREPDLSEGGGIRLAAVPGGRGLLLRFDAAALAASSEVIELEDGRLRGAWGPRLWRVALRARRPVAAGLWRMTASAEPE